LGGIVIYTTLISHFYNEEYLLPWWLLHHTKIFDHGILINRGSTDCSVEICRQLAPHWEVRDSKVLEFDAFLVDQEVMNIESEIAGWKMSLNTTEFLCFSNKEDFFSSLDLLGENMYLIEIIKMVDNLNHDYTTPTYQQPLVTQRYHGIYSDKLMGYFWGRYIHKNLHGQYLVGRHGTTHTYANYLNAVVLKFIYSPWNNAIKNRKLQIAPTLSEASIGLQEHYSTSLSQLEFKYNFFANMTQDLRLTLKYTSIFMNF